MPVKGRGAFYRMYRARTCPCLTASAHSSHHIIGRTYRREEFSEGVGAFCQRLISPEQEDRQMIQNEVLSGRSTVVVLVESLPRTYKQMFDFQLSAPSIVAAEKERNEL